MWLDCLAALAMAECRHDMMSLRFGTLAMHGRRGYALVLLLAAAALAFVPFAAHAPNRLLSGKPVGFAQAMAMSSAWICSLLAVCAVLLVLPLLRPRVWARWLAVLAAGGAAAALALIAGEAAQTLTIGAAASARTSFGAGFWVAVPALLLAAAEIARGLRPPALAALLSVGPIAVAIGSGALGALSIFREYAAQRAAFEAALLRHIELVAGALLPTLLIGIPLGIACWHREGLHRVALPVLNVIQTIPSIALFGLLMAPLAGLAAALPPLARIGIAGVGPAPALIALVLYALLPVVRNTIAGLQNVPEPVREAARGMGMTRAQAFWRIDVPLALPVLIAGVRITAVQSVGLAAVSALIGAGGLGAIMFQGLFANAQDLVLLGAVPVILLALAVDAGFRALAAIAE
jgi:osmoprotectant transport system permease protein